MRLLITTFTYISTFNDDHEQPTFEVYRLRSI